ncbi:LamG domain-containing protein [Candidatus Poribacteria bacterium]|nr:LamG domain-containing protein [Candidatus Poribacteria bacterium]MYB64937.1 LamG domain-containing protein [Candidatus Poribacteria bacterium]
MSILPIRKGAFSMYKIMTLLLFTFLVLSPQIMALDTNGLVGAWLMDESNGNTVSDSSGNGLDGKFAQGNPSWVKGKFGNGLEFGGSDMVTVDDDAALDLTSFTLSAWVNIPKISGPWQIIASKENRNPTGRNYGMFAHTNTGVVHYSFTTGGWKSFDAKTVITDGKWHHVVATYENPNFKLYLDGTVDAEQAPGTAPDNHDNFLFIGGCNIGNYWMSGVIDEVVLYNRALDETEINDLMDKGIENALDVKPGGKLVTTWSHIKSRSTR